MYRHDRDALSSEVHGLRHELDRMQAENHAMRGAMMMRGPMPILDKTVYQAGRSMWLSPGDRAAFSYHHLEETSVAVVALLHCLTLGIYSLIHFSLMHEKLPRVAHDDPSSGKAIGFTFIPYFNFYWIFFNSLRLTDRLNFQFELRGLPHEINRGIPMVASICSVIPYANILLAPIMWLVNAIHMQQAVNRLAQLGSGVPEAMLQGQAAPPGHPGYPQPGWGPQGGWGGPPPMGPPAGGWGPPPGGGNPMGPY